MSEKKVDFGERLKQVEREHKAYLEKHKTVPYSAQERIAYHRGFGAGYTYGRAEMVGRIAKSLSGDERRSFLNGWDAGREKAYKDRSRK